MNIMGSRGRFILTAPFTTLAPNGVQGQIIETVALSHLLSKGFDALTRVYEKANAEELYRGHVADDVVIVTILQEDGIKFTVPMTHISNINDISLHYRTGYVTVKIGQLPANYDYDNIKATLATTLTNTVGVQVAKSDVRISISQQDGVFYTPSEAEIEEHRRRSMVENNTTDYAKYINELKTSQQLREYVLELEQSIIDLSKTE